MLAWALAAALSGGCLPVDGARIRAADLARVHPVFSALPPEDLVAYAPNPGARRVFSPEELARLARRYGLQAGDMQAACFEYRTAPLQPAPVLAAIREAFPIPDASVELIDFSRWPVPLGKLEFPPRCGVLRPQTADGAVLCRGLLRYAGDRSVPVWAKARVRSWRQEVTAAESLPAGRPIQSHQVRSERRPSFPSSQAPIEDPSQAVGYAPRRALPAGATLYAALLTAPRHVERGDPVEVEVRSGAAKLTFSAKAESAGRTGERVVLRNESSGKRFVARVAGKGKARIETNTGETQ